MKKLIFFPNLGHEAVMKQNPKPVVPLHPSIFLCCFLLKEQQKIFMPSSFLQHYDLYKWFSYLEKKNIHLSFQHFETNKLNLQADAIEYWCHSDIQYFDKLYWQKKISLFPFTQAIVNSDHIHKWQQWLEMGFEKIVLKPRFSFAGKGFQFFPLVEWLKAPQNFPEYLIEPWVERIGDYGTIYVPNTKEFFHYQQLIQEKGAFLGIQSLKPDSDLDPLSIENFIHQQHLQAPHPISFDHFSYSFQGQKKWRLVNEVNYRYSVGFVFKELVQRLGFNQAQLRYQSVPSLEDLSSHELLLNPLPFKRGKKNLRSWVLNTAVYK